MAKHVGGGGGGGIEIVPCLLSKPLLPSTADRGCAAGVFFMQVSGASVSLLKSGKGRVLKQKAQLSFVNFFPAFAWFPFAVLSSVLRITGVDEVDDCNFLRQAVNDLKQTADKTCHLGPVVLLPGAEGSIVVFVLLLSDRGVAAGYVDSPLLAAASGVLKGVEQASPEISVVFVAETGS